MDEKMQRFHLELMEKEKVKKKFEKITSILGVTRK